jgi:hypothetical protein
MRAILSAGIMAVVTGCGLSAPQLSNDPVLNDTARPFAGVTARFANQVSLEVSNKIANHCAQRGWVVLQRTNLAVNCSKDLKPEESVVAALHAGDKLSSPPTYRSEFALSAVGTDTVVRAQHWIEIDQRVGGKRAVGGIDENNPRTNLRVFLREIGGALSG